VWDQTPGAPEPGAKTDPGEAAGPRPIAPLADEFPAAFAPHSTGGGRAAAWLAVLGALIIAGFAAAVFTHRAAPGPGAPAVSAPGAR
jgi:hypothetical protein